METAWIEAFRGSRDLPTARANGDVVAMSSEIERSRWNGLAEAFTCHLVDLPGAGRTEVGPGARIHLLEHELGAPLFERLQAGALLTDAGNAFLPHAEALLASMRDGTEAVLALRGPDRGVVTLAVVGTLASTPLTARLRRFREAHSGVDLRLRTALSPEVSELVLRGDATLGLRYGLDSNPHLESRKVHEEPMVPVCDPGHRLAGRKEVEPEELAGETWITFPPRPGRPREPYLATLERKLAALGLPDARILPIDSLTAQKRMVEAGFGLALLPASSLEEELRSGSLREMAIPALRTTIPVYLLQRKRAFQSGATKGLVELLEGWADFG
jgi:DNA-binding transcriptional LysR family regulator